ncbi:MAG: formate--tetrahydrofolate ligase [Myxococcales bacterium]|nr:formate--tetrahydrofolate ligase [Myxococcales bacterium]
MQNDPDAHPRPIAEIASRLGIGADRIRAYGDDVAKVDPRILLDDARRSSSARLILVSAITPTSAGEGKTTTSIGLSQALWKLGHASCLALRQPSLGPVFGMKGGATGGGRSEVLPVDRINLHFTGDFHAVTSAHNLLAALVDNHIHFGNALRIDPRRILWRRVMDMNDRALRNVIVGLGGKNEGIPRETGFDITAASEVMASLCLAEDEDDLRERLQRLLVAFTVDGEPVTADRLNGSGAMLALLRDALWPNLVQTTEGTPALLHGGPFANIAHGCSSVIATRMALHRSDYAITEAGFGFDLGAEKFFDIKCRAAGLDTAAVVLVATIRALRQHGRPTVGKGASGEHAVAAGLPNLDKHVENIQCFGETPVVALNRFADDSEAEIAVVRRHCEGLGVAFAVSDHFERGGEGALDLARCVVERAEKTPSAFAPLYASSDTVSDKVLAVARKMYGASEVDYTPQARRDLREVERLGYGDLPVCIAKTPSSLSDDPRRRGRPADFAITVRRVQINAGAGFLVVLTGDILRMPGLPREPRAKAIDLVDGEIVGVS